MQINLCNGINIAQLYVKKYVEYELNHNFDEKNIQITNKTIAFMKKLIIACAILMAGIFTSCGDTNFCYEITTKFTVLGWERTITTVEWITSNELDARIDEIKKDLVEKYGLSEETIVVTYQKLNKSQADCVVEE